MTGALVDSSGRYRIELCDGWTGCSDAQEYIGFNNHTCTAGVPPVSETYGDTVGPLLRSSGVSKNWRTWTVDVVKKMTDRTIVTIKNDFSEAKCTKHYIDDYSEKKDACKGTVWSDRVHLHKFPGQWTVKPAKGTDGECFNIINHEKPLGCLRYLSANSNCKERHLKLVEKDDGSGLQHWKFVKVGGGGGGSPSPDLPGSTCVSTGPANCAGCCKTKFEKNDGSFLDDSSCWKTFEYPQCDFEAVSPPQTAKIVSSTALTPSTGSVVVFSPPGTAVVEVIVGVGPSQLIIPTYQPAGYNTITIPSLAPGTNHTVKVVWKNQSGTKVVGSQTTVVTPATTTPTTPTPIPTITNLIPLNSTTVQGNAASGGSSGQCGTGEVQAFEQGVLGNTQNPVAVAVAPVKDSLSFSLAGLQAGKTYDVIVEYVCDGKRLQSTAASVTMPTTPSPSPTPSPAPTPSPGPSPALSPPESMMVSNLLSCYPSLSVSVGNAPANAQVVIQALCFDKSVADSPLLFGETTAPADYANAYKLVTVALGHLPPGYRCTLASEYQIIGSTERSGETFADFEIPANNTCTDQPTLLNPTLDPKTGETQFNIGPPACRVASFDVTAVPASGGANVTRSITQGENISLPLVSGTVYSNIYITANCRDGNSLTGSYGQYS